MKKAFKKSIILTGGSGLIGSYFKKKYEKKYKIINYPNRIENISKFENWVSKKKFNIFIHFAAITRNESKKFKKHLKLINVISTKKIIEALNKINISDFNYFLFISSSHVYGFSRNKFNEKSIRFPQNPYGKSKKKVEDFIIANRRKFNFKIGIARIFNTTGYKQKKGNFVPDMIEKIKKNNRITNVNQFRDFIHIDDVCKSIELIIKKQFIKPINIASGKKINLINVCKIINKLYVKKKDLFFEEKKGRDLIGDNSLLKKIGIKKFKNIKLILKSYKK